MAEIGCRGRLGGVDARQGRGGNHLARLHVQDEPCGALRPVAADGGVEFVLERMLHADVDREANRGAIRELGTMYGIDADGIVDVFLDARDALVVDIDGAEDVAGEAARGIGAAKLVAKGEARKPEIVHLLCNFGRETAAHPDEAARAIGKRAPQFRRVEIGQNRCELLDEFVAVENDGRVGEKRGRLDIGRKQAAIAVDDVGAGEIRRCAFGDGEHGDGRGAHAEADEPHGDSAEGDEDRQAEHEVC